MKADHIPLSQTLFVRLAAEAIDVHTTLHRAGLPAALATQKRPGLTTENFFALWRAIDEEGRHDPALGLRIGAASRAEECDISSLAALHSANLGDALAKLARYKRLTCPEDVSIECARGEAAMGFRWTLAHGHAPPLLVDAICASAVELARRGTGEKLSPRRIELTRRQRHKSVLTDHFGCEIRFNAAHDRLVFAHTDLRRPFVTHRTDRLTELLPVLESSLQERQAGITLNDQVYQVIVREMRGQPLRISHVAGALHMSTRTLQRRLGDAGTSYQILLDQARQHTARHLLDATDLQTGEIAFLLGFEELNSFHRAFRQWESSTPSRWRSIAD